ncbi:leucyl aminopeptidase [Streptomyces sp. WAC 06738]|uniref:leucyl aminopeptidase n=1 Tax=Streptomyces sp. WAC 06738 TaxID=2203210 RepID=UPI000F70C273|nr:leucyl aminopeptidase [Streptomyces sp. WAC 06738]AZM45636.1 leucyl aminopeptidase [Streptomyces sp. WAC 06738]
MTALTLSSSSATGLRADAVVVGVAKGPKGPVPAPGAEAVDEAYGGKLGAVLEALGASGGEGEVTKLPAPDGLKAPVVVAVGLGAVPEKGAGYDTETLRRAAGSAARALAGAKKAAFALPLDVADDTAAVAEGALLGAYAFNTYRGGTAADDKGDKDEKGAKGTKGGKAAKGKANGGAKAALGEIALLGAKRDKAHRAAVERAAVLADEVNRARDLVNIPSNDLDPSGFAAAAQQAGKEHGFKVTVTDEKALAKGGYGGILGVGQGSQTPPRLVRLEHRHPKAEQTIALVGKGITYDSGGISLKPAGHNETMKCDMSGAAAVLAAVSAAARLELPVNVTGWLALAENMPSGSATRPGDVLRMYSGKTVEVLNTDAEGRLVLADALTKASEEKPDYMIDVATLTGAMVLALGNRTFGIMANDDAFRTRIHVLAEAAGEQSWPMPMPPELKKGMESPIADIANMGERMGGGLVAGLFLEEFVGEGITWAHLDIAGPAFNTSGPFGYTPKGGTGSAVRTLVAIAEEAAHGDLV